ncbi:MAG: helix-turn-helix transcriptional regulator [Lachnospiraceae bacterium]|nr:helix-turn-helix transcriptional regulator [Lachnospiraceae bacterium]
MNTGERIKELRKKFGWLQSDLAIRVGCSTQVISNLERSCSKASADMAARIAEQFHIPIDDLLLDEPPAQITLSSEEKNLVLDYRKLLPNERKMLLEMFTVFLKNK